MSLCGRLVGSRMKTTIDLPAELLIEIKKRAADERTTMREIFERALRKELGTRAARGSRKKPLDTNLLIYAHRKHLSEHGAARRAIEEASLLEGGWSIPSPCLAAPHQA
jgi:metal-responsive CopG/Arc/MetJ family transcriptional regulator